MKPEVNETKKDWIQGKLELHLYMAVITYDHNISKDHGDKNMVGCLIDGQRVVGHLQLDEQDNVVVVSGIVHILRDRGGSVHHVAKIHIDNVFLQSKKSNQFESQILFFKH